MRIADALVTARELGVDRLDAQLLIARLLGCSRTWLLAHDDTALDNGQSDRLLQHLRQRAAGVPCAYLLGEVAFCELMLSVSADVLVPRPETELLVDWALERAAHVPQRSLVDLGTGSGAIALALKHRLPAFDVGASDASGAALQVARGNGSRLGLTVDWRLGDWWAPWQAQRFGLAVANPPYVAGEDPHLAALAHEPRAALTPGGDGLSALLQIVAAAPAHLWPGAWLLLEHGHDQDAAVREALTECGFQDVQTRRDLGDLPRCTGGLWPHSKTAAAASQPQADRT
jgi:release factor glutamine methyltransferase